MLGEKWETRARESLSKQPSIGKKAGCVIAKPINLKNKKRKTFFYGPSTAIVRWNMKNWQWVSL